MIIKSLSKMVISPIQLSQQCSKALCFWYISYDTWSHAKNGTGLDHSGSATGRPQRWGSTEPFNRYIWTKRFERLSVLRELESSKENMVLWHGFLQYLHDWEEHLSDLPASRWVVTERSSSNSSIAYIQGFPQSIFLITKQKGLEINRWPIFYKNV